jgi:phosphoserine phosphatase
MKTYKGMLSSDWSQCLSPNGPFDPLIFLYPEMESELSMIFRRYTGNEISLGQAIDRINTSLPRWPSTDQLDRYLDNCFETYPGVPALIRWCRQNGILFMVNTTGFAAYFQRVFFKTLLPAFDVLSAQIKWSFHTEQNVPEHLVDLNEVEDKARNTAAVAHKFSIPHGRIILMGDSGGDGPHFQWGAKIGATLVGSMTKPSLSRYCSEREITIHHHIGHTYGTGEQVSIDKERDVDFRALIEIIEDVLGVAPESARRA